MSMPRTMRQRRRIRMAAAIGIGLAVAGRSRPDDTKRALLGERQARIRPVLDAGLEMPLP